MTAERVFIVVRTEGEYEPVVYPVRAFETETEADTFARKCSDVFKRQHELFAVARARHGEKWWEYDVKKTDAIEARYERKLPNRCCIRNSDVSWGVWEIPFSSGQGTE